MSFLEASSLFPKSSGIESSVLSSESPNIIFPRKFSTKINLTTKSTDLKHSRYLSQFTNYSKIKDILCKIPPAHIGLSKYKCSKLVNYPSIRKSSQRAYFSRPVAHLNLIPILSERKKNKADSKELSTEVETSSFDFEKMEYESQIIETLNEKPKRKTILSKIANKNICIPE